MARQRHPRALLRARFRTAFFIVLLVSASALGHSAAAAVAAAGLVLGLLTVAAARRHGNCLAHSFVVVDWLLYGCVVALAGQSESWLLVAVPVLTAGQLGLSSRAEWPYILAPAPLLAVVLAIADPSFGGHKYLTLALLAVLVAGGVIAAGRLGIGHQRRQRRARFDPVSGLYAARCLHEIGAVRLDVAAARGEDLSLAYLRLEGIAAMGGLHAHGRDAVIRHTGGQLKARLESGDYAFRLGVDEFVVLLPGRTSDQAGKLMRTVAQDVMRGIAAGRRLELSVGCAAFPTRTSLDDLLRAAQAGATASAASPAQLSESGVLAAAQ